MKPNHLSLVLALAFSCLQALLEEGVCPLYALLEHRSLRLLWSQGHFNTHLNVTRIWVLVKKFVFFLYSCNYIERKTMKLKRDGIALKRPQNLTETQVWHRCVKVIRSVWVLNYFLIFQNNCYIPIQTLILMLCQATKCNIWKCLWFPWPKNLGEVCCWKFIALSLWCYRQVFFSFLFGFSHYPWLSNAKQCKVQKLTFLTR